MEGQEGEPAPLLVQEEQPAAAPVEEQQQELVQQEVAPPEEPQPEGTFNVACPEEVVVVQEDAEQEQEQPAVQEEQPEANGEQQEAPVVGQKRTAEEAGLGEDKPEDAVKEPKSGLLPAKLNAMSHRAGQGKAGITECNPAYALQMIWRGWTRRCGESFWRSLRRAWWVLGVWPNPWTRQGRALHGACGQVHAAGDGPAIISYGASSLSHDCTMTSCLDRRCAAMTWMIGPWRSWLTCLQPRLRSPWSSSARRSWLKCATRAHSCEHRPLAV